MSSDTKAIIGTVVAIGGLVLGQGFYLNARIDDVNVSVNARIDDMQGDIRELRALVIDAIKRAEPAA